MRNKASDARRPNIYHCTDIDKAVLFAVLDMLSADAVKNTVLYSNIYSFLPITPIKDLENEEEELWTTALCGHSD